MRQRRTLHASVRGRLIALATVVVLAATFFSYQHRSSIQVVDAQAPRQPRKLQSRRTAPARTRASLPTRFNHEHHRAPTTKLDCAYCHTIPMQSAPDVIAAATKFSIKGHPYHDSCLDCHRSKTPPLFFRGATPAICTVCHTRSSPRLTHRDLISFPKHNEQARDLEFPGFFPHAQRKHKEEACKSCHATDNRPYVSIKINGSDEPYTPPTAGAFKTSPSGHAACFKCHWEDAKPRKDQCAGCHLLNEDFADEGRNVLSANATKWFKSWPLGWPKRFSLKFNHDSHEREDHQKPDCTDCHTNVAEMNTLDILKADVKIAACATCHFRKPPNIGEEMTEEDRIDTREGKNINPESKGGKYTCIGCHTKEIGSAPPPCSHYLIPDKYLDLEEYSENARQTAKKCKESKK